MFRSLRYAATGALPAVSVTSTLDGLLSTMRFTRRPVGQKNGQSRTTAYNIVP